MCCSSLNLHRLLFHSLQSDFCIKQLRDASDSTTVFLVMIAGKTRPCAISSLNIHVKILINMQQIFASNKVPSPIVFFLNLSNMMLSGTTQKEEKG